MKVVKVKIVLGRGFDSWTQYFSDYPTLETIRLRLRKIKNLRNFAKRLSDNGWTFVENPDRFVQQTFCCGVWVGSIEMSEKNVYMCVEQQTTRMNKE